MFDTLFTQPSIIARHINAPYREERERYLRHCEQQGYTLQTMLLREQRRVSGLHIDKIRDFTTSKMDTDRPKKPGGRVISRAVRQIELFMSEGDGEKLASEV